MVETLILAVTAFAGTNVDDILINAFFFSEAGTKAEERSVVAGKYIGIGALILISLLGAFGLHFLPQRVLGWLGLVPVALGVREAMKSGEETVGASRKVSGLMRTTALVTMASGADNIGVYVPLFAGFTAWQTALTVGVFMVLIALWCRFGKLLAGLPGIRRALEKHRRTIVPAVYIALGIYILLKNFL